LIRLPFRNGSIIGLAFLFVQGTAPEPARLEVRFIGNMAFAITDGKTTLFTDFPYQSGAFGYMRYDTAAVSPAPDALCLITHGHADHFDPELFGQMGAALIGPPSLSASVKSERAIPFAPSMAYRDIRIEAFRTPHGEIEHYSYLVTWHGLRLYFTGDTHRPEKLLAARDLDAAFVSPWLIEEVASRKGRIDARRLVVCHHKTGEAIADLQQRLVPKQGQSFTIEPKPQDLAPKEGGA
jgi:L-ascorbate metabolism protein UlaG (beta-lactamase superfamily)